MRLYSYSAECVTTAEVRWISFRFVLLSVVAGAVLFGVVIWNSSVTADFHPKETERLILENSILRDHMANISHKIVSRQDQLMQLQERDGVLNVLLHDRTMYGDSFVTTVISLTALQQHAFQPMEYFRTAYVRVDASKEH